MKTEITIPYINLQLFAEGAGASGAVGADGGTGVGGQAGNNGMLATSDKGAKGSPAQEGVQTADAQTQATDTEGTPAVDRNAEFEKLIKGEYKDLYNAKVQDTIQRRLKGTREIVDKYKALAPTLEIIANKYGIDASDIDALKRAVEEDDSYYEEEALEKGMSVNELKYKRKLDQINRERETKERADKLYQTWMEQAEATKHFYPSFNLETEMQNERFTDLLRSNVDVRSAFEVVHKDELMAGMMQAAAQKAAEKVANSVRANGARPAENGVSSQSSAAIGVDVSKLTKAQRQDYIRRAAAGEKISFK